jgi:xanthine/CO dehydrogenase XdhC/CoxF family maturation factor
VEALRTNPRPEGALSMDERSGRYEEFIAGYWIAWRIIDTEKEIVIQVGITE